MRLIVTTEHRFLRLPDGSTWTDGSFPHSFWRRYLEVFDEVRVLARARPVSSVASSWKRVDGAGVSVTAVPYYVGPLAYLRVRSEVKRCLMTAVRPDDAVIVRLASTLANALTPVLERRGHPFGAEVVGDPVDTFVRGGVRHPLRPFFRVWFANALARQCRTATAVSYVTERGLQRRYPSSPGAYSTHYSSIELPAGAIAAAPRPPRAEQPFRLVMVGSLEQLYKGPDVLLHALAKPELRGLDVEARIIGGGKHLAELQALASSLGVTSRVRFIGHLSGADAVRAELDDADLFVLPSRTEGLPRALIEAMARGLPAVATLVGGIPELLPDECLVPPGDAGALASLIARTLRAPAQRSEWAARNLERARDYREDVLQQRRNAMYRHLAERTAAYVYASRKAQ